ncbi:MAG: hypothetical protein U0271_42960 [Polyangiaceae bacterium]
MNRSWVLGALLGLGLSGCGDSGDPTILGGAGGESAAGGSGGSGPAVTTTTGPTTTTGTHTATAHAVIGGPDSVVSLSSVGLDGSGSFSDWDDAIVEYTWSQVDGAPIGGLPTHGANVNITAPSIPGPITVALVVDDGNGPSAPTEIVIDVLNQPPHANAGPDQSGQAGETVTLVGSGVDPDQGNPVGFQWTQISGPTVPLSSSTDSAPTLVLPADLAEPVVYQLVTFDGWDESEPDWVTVVRTDGADVDHDLLGAAEEIAYGTDPNNPDTDGDGLPDGWEVMNHEGVDFAALGCDPLHADLNVAAHGQAYTDVNGDPAVFEMAPALASALEAFYAGLPLSNPDGSSGVALHFVAGSPIPETFVCTPGLSPGDPIPNDFALRDAFHHAAICRGLTYAGYAAINGNQFWLTFPAPNDDPADDPVEAALYSSYALFIHEMGHNLSLFHGGNENRNFKPNYPSVMNYAYTFGLSEAHKTLADPSVAFSHGTMPTLDECALVERGALGGAAPELIEALGAFAYMPYTYESDGSVDFNRNGTIEDEAYSYPELVEDPTACELDRDSDDFAMVRVGLHTSLPCDPGATNFSHFDAPLFAP